MNDLITNLKSLFLSESHGKNFDGSTRYPSRFILDIDQKFLEYVKKPEDTLIAETVRRVSINPQGSLGWSTSFIQYGLRAIGYLRLVLYTKKNPE